jgi:hypothetical protein
MEILFALSSYILYRPAFGDRPKILKRQAAPPHNAVSPLTSKSSPPAAILRPSGICFWDSKVQRVLLRDFAGLSLCSIHDLLAPRRAAREPNV